MLKKIRVTTPGHHLGTMLSKVLYPLSSPQGQAEHRECSKQRESSHIFPQKSSLGFVSSLAHPQSAASAWTILVSLLLWKYQWGNNNGNLLTRRHGDKRIQDTILAC